MDPRTSSSFSDDVPFVVLMLVDSKFSSNAPFDILMRVKAVVFLALSFALRARAVHVSKHYAESYSDLITLIHVKHLVTKFRILLLGVFGLQSGLLRRGFSRRSFWLVRIGQHHNRYHLHSYGEEFGLRSNLAMVRNTAFSSIVW